MMNQAFFKKYEVELKEKDAVKYLMKMLKKIHKIAAKAEDYETHLAAFEEAYADFKEAKG